MLTFKFCNGILRLSPGMTTKAIRDIRVIRG